MNDLLSLGAAALFFAVTAGLVRLCDDLDTYGKGERK